MSPIWGLLKQGDLASVKVLLTAGLEIRLNDLRTAQQPVASEVYSELYEAAASAHLPQHSQPALPEDLAWRPGSPAMEDVYLHHGISACHF